MWPYKPLTTVILLAPMVFTFALAMDIYMPAIAEIKALFHASQSAIQLTLSLFLLITGFGQLILGPLSDYTGRYKMLLLASVIFLLGSLLCSTANTVYALIIYRIIQSVGACGMSVTTFAIVRDAFHGRTTAMIYSFLNALLSVSPILGPLIGIWIISFFPWYAVFYFLSILGVLNCLLILCFVKESLRKENREIVNLGIFKHYASICTSLTFWAYTLPCITGVSAFFTLFSMTPYIIQTLHQPIHQIGIFFGLAGASFLVGSLISGIIVHRLGIYKTTLSGVILIFIAGIILLSLYHFYGLSLWRFFGPSMIATFGCALTMGSGASGAMEPFGDFVGAASAMFGALQLGGAAVIGSIVTLFPMNTSIPLGIEMITMALISFSLLMLFLIYKSQG